MDIGKFTLVVCTCVWAKANPQLVIFLPVVHIGWKFSVKLNLVHARAKVANLFRSENMSIAVGPDPGLGSKT